MKTIYAGKLNFLPLGRRAEHMAARVLFDISEWEAIYGKGRPELLYQRPDMDPPYIRQLKAVDDGVAWEITDWDTELVGSGKCELRYYVGDTLVKSDTWRTRVDPALDTPTGETPEDPRYGWVDQVLKAGAQAVVSAEVATQAAEEVRGLVAQVEGELVDEIKNAAQLAVEAQEAAQVAEGAAQRAATQARESSQEAEVYAHGLIVEQHRKDENGDWYVVEVVKEKGAQQYAEMAAQSARDAQSLIEDSLGGLEGVDARISEIEADIADLKYKPIEITSFTNDGGTKELGASVSAVKLTWTTNRAPVRLTLDGQVIDPTKTQETVVALSGYPIRETTTFRLVATDEKGATANKTTTVPFYNGIYYGAASAPTAIDSAFVLGLGNKVLTGTKNRTVKITGGDGRYAWFAYPKWLGKSLFNIGGFDYEWELETISFTNSLDYTEDYYVYRSGQYAPASLSLTVKDGG